MGLVSWTLLAMERDHQFMGSMGEDIHNKISRYPVFGEALKLGDVIQWTTDGRLHCVGNLVDFVADRQRRRSLDRALRNPCKAPAQNPHRRLIKDARVTFDASVDGDVRGMTEFSDDVVTAPKAMTDIWCRFMSPTAYVFEWIGLEIESLPDAWSTILHDDGYLDCLAEGELVVVEIGRAEKAAWAIAHEEGAEIMFSAECAVNSTAGAFCYATSLRNRPHVETDSLGKDDVALIGVIPVTTTGVNFERRTQILLQVQAEKFHRWRSTRPSLQVGLTTGIVVAFSSLYRSVVDPPSTALVPPAAETVNFEAQFKIANPKFLKEHAFDDPMCCNPNFLNDITFPADTANPNFLNDITFPADTANPDFLNEITFDVPTPPPPPP